MWFDAFSKRPGIARLAARAVFAAVALLAAVANAGQLTVAWDPVANATGYKVYYGTSSTSYSASIDAKTATTQTISGLTDGARYYFAVTAYNGTAESGFSSQVNAVVPTATAAPAASFTASPLSGPAPLAVTLTDTSTGSITGRSWNLGDGTTSSSQTVAKTYSAPGTYTVTLTVTGTGGSTTATRSITVTAAAPVASFSATPVTGTAPLTVAFTDSSSGTVTSWAWDFGDGGTSTSRNPSYTYNTPGTYSVSLTVTGSGGSNKLTRTGLVAVTAPTTTSAPPPSTSPTTTASGLVAAYGFEETGGTTVFDASGNGNHGTLSGARRATGAPFGRALRFDGVDDWVTIKDSNSLDLTSGVTLQAWVYPTATMSGWRTALIKERSGTPMYSLYVNGDSQRPATIVESGGAERILSAGGALPVKRWTHLASTYDGTNQKIYVNGELVGSRPQTGTIAVSGGALRIAGNAVWGEYFAGLIDEVRVYNRALSQAEIAADANRAVVALQLSTSGKRSNPVPLHGQTVSGNVYIFYADLGPSSGTNPVKQVRFWLNHPQPANPTGTPRLTENVAPFDFAGTATDGTAMPLNTATLAKGTHTVSAQAVLSDGTVLPVRVGTFVVP